MKIIKRIIAVLSLIVMAVAISYCVYTCNALTGGEEAAKTAVQYAACA